VCEYCAAWEIGCPRLNSLASPPHTPNGTAPGLLIPTEQEGELRERLRALGVTKMPEIVTGASPRLMLDAAVMPGPALACRVRSEASYARART
jgi:hypothetical protein